MTTSESINELAAALGKAQAEFPPVKRENLNPFFKSKYADLATIFSTVRATLGKHGLSVIQSPEPADGNRVTITTRLMHSSGQWIQSESSMPVSKPDAQGHGSGLTYARRYALQSFLGIAAEEDDDGSAAVSTPYEKKHAAVIAKAETQRPIPDEEPEWLRDGPTDAPERSVAPPLATVITVPQGKRAFAISKSKGWSEGQLMNLLGEFGYEHLNDLPKTQYEGFCTRLEAGPRN